VLLEAIGGDVKVVEWTAQLAAASAAAKSIQAMQASSAANPLAALAGAIGSVEAGVAAVSGPGGAVGALLGNVTLFNGLFYNNASTAMRGLLNQVGWLRTVVAGLQVKHAVAHRTQPPRPAGS
jgi:hypothetical protein